MFFATWSDDICTGEDNSTRINIKQLSGLAESLKVRGLKFILQNIRSLRAKLNEINILITHCSNLHVIAFTDFWLNNNILNAEIFLPGFNFFRNDRKIALEEALLCVLGIRYLLFERLIWKAFFTVNAYC